VVNDNDTNLIERRNMTLAFPETRLTEVDSSSQYNQNSTYQFIDQDNSVVNIIDDRSLSLVSIQEPTFNFDNSTTVHLVQNIQAPERSGGSIVSGNA
jgi:hypothetical protein